MRKATYDRRAALYDAVVGSSLYLKLFWGTSPASNTAFARRALEAARDGRFAEIGCGSLLFTSRNYDATRAASVTLVDLAEPMIRRGLQRLGAGVHGVGAVRADAAKLPLRSHAFRAILSLNLLHVVDDRAGIIAECMRVLEPGGQLFLSVLVRTGRWSDAWLSSLHRTGEMGPPMTLEAMRAALEPYGVIESQSLEGNLAFLVVRRI